MTKYQQNPKQNMNRKVCFLFLINFVWQFFFLALSLSLFRVQNTVTLFAATFLLFNLNPYRFHADFGIPALRLRLLLTLYHRAFCKMNVI